MVITCEGCNKVIIITRPCRWYCDECRVMIDRRGVLDITSLDPNDPHQDLDLGQDTLNQHSPRDPQ